jgi:anti-sigma factor RsiW
MESSFEERNDGQQPAHESSETNEQYNRFELLSAYLDGEVTAAERKQVQEWLDTDPKMQKLYTRLLRLHQEIDSLPVPPAAPSTVQLSEQVFARIDRKRRSKQFVFLGGAAIAAVVIGAFSNLLFRNDFFAPQVVEAPTAPLEQNSEHLMIALNHPIIEIPAAAILPSETSKKTNPK